MSFKVISFEWCTDLPNKNNGLWSPEFILKGVGCSLSFNLENSNGNWFYNLYVYLKSRLSELECCQIQVGFKKQRDFGLGKTTFKLLEISDKKIWCISSADMQLKLPPDYMDGNVIQFLFSVRKVKKDVDDKSIQTPSYSDTRLMLESISKNMSKIFDEGSYYDVEFTCGDQIIKAHKNILCSLSDVFKTMLHSDMVEGHTGRVDIQDMDPNVFRQFLRCLYTGNVPELTVDIAVQFYKASDKYVIDTLKTQCIDFLKDNLCVENACEILVLADLYNDIDLKRSAVAYIFKEKIHLMEEIWTGFCNENHKLAIEVFNSFCNDFYNK